MALTDVFKKGAGETGYKKALDSSTSDIMRQLDGATSSLGNARSANSDNSAFFPGAENRQSFTDSLFKGDTQEVSVMSKLHAGKSYAPGVSTKNLLRNPDKAVKDGANASSQVAAGLKDVKMQKDEFQKDWKQDRADAVAMLKETAGEMGIDPSQAENDLVGKGPGSDMAMLAGAGALGVLSGGGSLAAQAGIAVVSLKNEIGKEAQKLPPKQQEALMQATLEKLQSNSSKVDPMQMAGDAAGASGGAKPVQTDADFSKLNQKEFADVLKADPNGDDQPEMRELADAENGLNDIKDNHCNVERHYGDKVTTRKLDEIDTAKVEAPTLDSVGFMLAGEGVASVSMKEDEGFTSDVPESLKPVLAQQDLSREMDANLGMG